MSNESDITNITTSSNNCACEITGLPVGFEYYLSAGIAFSLCLSVCIVYNLEERKRKKTFYGVEDKMEAEEVQRERAESLHNRPTEMKIVTSKEPSSLGGNSFKEEVKVLVKAPKRRSGSVLVHDFTPDWASTPALTPYMRRSDSYPASGAASKIPLSVTNRPSRSRDLLNRSKEKSRDKKSKSREILKTARRYVKSGSNTQLKEQ